MKYIPGFDSLRAFAVGLVIVAHWLPGSLINKYIPTGSIGVDMFFVLSGYLISHILLENRRKLESNNGRIGVIKNFVIRRALRIFPIYYLLIIIVYAFSANSYTSIDKNILYYVTYTINFKYFLSQSWDNMLSHIWSLAIEEQFYLLWPWLMIYIPEKKLGGLIIGFILFGCFSNHILGIVTSGTSLSGFTDVLTPTAFDAFGLGALLAYVTVYKPGRFASFSKIVSVLALISLASLVIQLTFNILHFFPLRTLIAFISLHIIIYIKNNHTGAFSAFFLNNKLIIYFGKISYGIYLYHNIMHWVWSGILSFLNAHEVYIPLINSWIPQILYGEILFIQKFILLITISWLSWNYIEKPVNGLKKYFNYTPLKLKAQYSKN